MLAIAIGIAAVIVLVSIMDGITGQVTDIFEGFGMNNITVSITSRGSTRFVEPKDLYELVDENPNLYAYCSPKITTMANIKSPNSSESSYASITGIDETFDEIDGLATAQGRFLQYVDIDKMLKVCVIGTYYEEEYYEEEYSEEDYVNADTTRVYVGDYLEEDEDYSEFTEKSSSTHSKYKPARARTTPNQTIGRIFFPKNIPSKGTKII